jgi:hypothetical protein
MCTLLVVGCASGDSTKTADQGPSRAEVPSDTSGGGAPSDSAPAAASELATLRQFIGKYPYEGVNYLAVDPLKRRLGTLLGEKYPIFLENMNVIGPLGDDGGLLYTYGNAPHRGMIDVGAIVVDPGQDAIYVWLMEQRKVSEFREHQKTVRVPPYLQTFLANVLAAEDP